MGIILVKLFIKLINKRKLATYKCLLLALVLYTSCHKDNCVISQCSPLHVHVDARIFTDNTMLQVALLFFIWWLRQAYGYTSCAHYIITKCTQKQSLGSRNKDLYNLLKTKRNLLYVRNQFVPRSKHFLPL